MNLDAGYVSILPVHRVDLHGRKLYCVIFVTLALFFISLLNLTCLVWVMSKLDRPSGIENSSKTIRIDEVNNQIEFCQRAIFEDSISTDRIAHKVPMEFSSGKQFDIHTDQNELRLDDNQILFQTHQFFLKNQNLTNLTNLYSLKFDCETKTRVHLNAINSQHIHDKHLNITANDYLKISNVDQAFIYGHHLIFNADRYNRRSMIRLRNPLTSKAFLHNNEEMFSEKIHFKSDSVYLDLPRLPLLNNHHQQREYSISRLCICNTTLLFLRNFAHLPCPIC